MNYQKNCFQNSNISPINEWSAEVEILIFSRMVNYISIQDATPNLQESLKNEKRQFLLPGKTNIHLF